MAGWEEDLEGAFLELCEEAVMQEVRERVRARHPRRLPAHLLPPPLHTNEPHRASALALHTTRRARQHLSRRAPTIMA